MTREGPADVFAGLLGDDFACEERRSFDGPMLAHPLEIESVGRAVAKRRREFLTGRTCARLALRRLGLEAGPLLAAPSRAPQWPAGAVGSITHTEGYCAAAVASSGRIASVGIDAQAIDAVSAPLWRLLFGPAEMALLAAEARCRRPELAALLFAAKEAFFKCQHPLTERMLSFQAVTIRPTPAGFAVCGPPVEALGPRPLDGRWAAANGIAFAAVWASASGARGSPPAQVAQPIAAGA